MPAVPFGDRQLASTDWVAWFAVVGGLLLALDGRVRPLAVPLRFLAIAGLVGLSLRSAIEYQWEGAEVALWLSGLGALVLLLGLSVATTLRDSEGPSAPLAYLIASTALAVCSGLSGSAKLAQTVGLVCAMLGALWIVRWLKPASRVRAADGTWLVMVLFGLGLTAHFYSELTGTDALLLAAAFAAPRLADRGPLAGLAKGQPRRVAILRVVLALLPAAIALTRAGLAFELEPEDPYGDYYDYDWTAPTD